MNIISIATTVMSIILVIILIIFGIMLSVSKSNAKFPPVDSMCPDYWETNKTKDDPENQFCFNVKNIGNKSCEKKIDFSGPMWTGVNGLCEKQKWANKCQQVWDGVTNVKNAC